MISFSKNDFYGISVCNILLKNERYSLEDAPRRKSFVKRRAISSCKNDFYGISVCDVQRCPFYNDMLLVSQAQQYYFCLNDILLKLLGLRYPRETVRYSLF